MPYAGVQLCLGWTPDRFGAARMLGVLLLLAAAAMISFGSWGYVPLLLLLTFLNGAAQSLTWSACIKVAAQTWTEPSRSKVVGVLATSSFAGGIVATTASVYLLSSQGWKGLFFWPSVVVALLGILVLAWLDVGPASGQPSYRKDSYAPAIERLTMRQIWSISMVLFLSSLSLYSHLWLCFCA